MTVERREIMGGKVVKKEAVVPGYQEIIKKINPIAAFFEVSGTETIVGVVSDDEITVTQADLEYVGQRAWRTTDTRSSTLTKHQINEHNVQSSPSLTGRVIRFAWVPSRSFISPEQEKIIQELIGNGTYTDEDAQAVRDNLIYQAQRDQEQI